MQPAPGGSSNSTGGGGGRSGGGGSQLGLGRGVLPRFRSAPATWLEALLEGEEEDPLKQNHNLTELLASNSASAATTTTAAATTSTSATSRTSLPFTAGTGGGSSSSSAEPRGLFEQVPTGGFQRQNSSPADFLGNSGGIGGADGYFASFGIASRYDFLSPNMDVSPSGKRAREVEFPQPAAKYTPQMKEEQSGQIPGGASSLMELEMEKLLEDSVPCKVRAKRGCATHPRSIAERVRRTKISDRIRKLQELVPKMDKQTNTADMLEEAVEYVKFLQRQIQELTELQKKCKCMAKE